MPLKSKEKTKTDGAKKSGSVLSTMFRKYNPDKVTANGLKNFFGLVFYKTGYDIEIAALKIYKKAAVMFDRVAGAIVSVLKTSLNFLDKLTETILDDLGEPLDKVGRLSKGDWYASFEMLFFRLLLDSAVLLQNRLSSLHRSFYIQCKIAGGFSPVLPNRYYKLYPHIVAEDPE